MKLALRWFGHQSWELLPKETGFSKIKDAPLSWVEQASQFVVKRLRVDAEPRVWHTCDAEGNLWWHAHDAVTGRSLYDASESEMRIWLEQRYVSASAH
jgi:hypothetical protein